jgi:hypothetical protein
MFVIATKGWTGMTGRYTGSYFDRPNGWRAVATLAEIGQASLVARIPKMSFNYFARAVKGVIAKGSVEMKDGKSCTRGN